MDCISCNKTHNEKFCPNCGEKSGVDKITIVSILEHAFSSVTNMDKGFLFNLKSLILEPKKITTDYIAGRRKGILNPISYLIIAITIYIIVINVFREPRAVEDVDTSTKMPLQKVAYEVGGFLRTYIKYFWILAIIPLGFSIKLAFRKYNVMESIAIGSFVIGQATLISVVSYLLFKIPLIFDPFIYLTICFLVYKIFNDQRQKIESLLLTIAALVLFVIQLIISFITIGVFKAFL